MIRPLLFNLLVCVIVLAAVNTPHPVEVCGPSGCFKRFYGPQFYPHRRYFDRAPLHLYRRWDTHPPWSSNWNRDYARRR
jgi:hypothetical protein